MEFFIEDASRPMWHRVVSSDIIMCEQVGKLVYVYRRGRPVIHTPITIDRFKLKYLKGQERFIRSSSEHIVNKDMIVSMVERRATLYLILEEDREALIRKSHDFAYFIKTNEKKPNRDEELYKDNQDYIDKIITVYGDCDTIKKLVQEKTGVALTTKYIRERYKIIKYG